MFKAKNGLSDEIRAKAVELLHARRADIHFGIRHQAIVGNRMPDANAQN
jgi:hypothetical protein